MEVVRFAVAVVFVLFSVSSSNAEPTPAMGGGAGGGDAHSMPCIQKLMPCQPYLHSVTPPPPASCCLPMKEIVEKDATCLCSVFNNVDMLKSLNLTKENALVLPKACGAKADISLCKSSNGKPLNTTPFTVGFSLVHARFCSLSLLFLILFILLRHHYTFDVAGNYHDSSGIFHWYDCIIL